MDKNPDWKVFLNIFGPIKLELHEIRTKLNFYIHITNTNLRNSLNEIRHIFSSAKLPNNKLRSKIMTEWVQSKSKQLISTEKIH